MKPIVLTTNLKPAVLEQRREKTRALKQAMMQELLPERTRLGYLDERALFEKAINPKTNLNYEESILLWAYTGYDPSDSEYI